MGEHAGGEGDVELLVGKRQMQAVEIDVACHLRVAPLGDLQTAARNIQAGQLRTGQVAVHEEEVAKKVETFAAQLGLSWDNVLVSAPPEQLFEALGLDHQKIPQTVVLGADGQVLHHARGPMDEAQISRVYALLTGS